MFSFPIVWLIWFTSEAILNLLFKSERNNYRVNDKGSVKGIWITIAIANTSGLIISMCSDLFISYDILFPYIGLIVIILGMILRYYSIWFLGYLFNFDHEILENHRIVTNGIYKYIRHPSYLGSMISFAGFGLSLNNWIALFIVTVPVFMALTFRINTEEDLLVEQFGTEYSEYKKKTYRMFPPIY